MILTLVTDYLAEMSLPPMDGDEVTPGLHYAELVEDEAGSREVLRGGYWHLSRAPVGDVPTVLVQVDCGQATADFIRAHPEKWLEVV